MNPTDDNPSFEINFEHEAEYLRAEIFGQRDSYEVTTQYWNRIADELGKTGYKRLLIVEMLQEDIDIRDAIRVIRERDRSKFEGVKIAFFDLRRDHRATNKYGAAAASLLGYDMELFSDLREAKNWLLASSDPQE